MKILILLLLTLSSHPALSADHPPGYILTKKCQQRSQVKVCVFNHSKGHPQLRVEYLRSTDYNSVWIKLNGREGVFPLSDNSVLLNEYRNVHRCVVRGASNKYPVDYYPECPSDFVSGLRGYPRGLIWFFETPKEQEAELFFYARNQYGRANAWDIELAFVDRYGNWDSRSGANYKFTFRP